MTNLYKVGIHIDNDYGYIEYDQDARQLRVFLDNEQKKAEVEKFLQTEHVIAKAGNRLLDFTDAAICAEGSLADLQLALTRLWKSTRVLVDWSRPVD